MKTRRILILSSVLLIVGALINFAGCNDKDVSNNKQIALQKANVLNQLDKLYIKYVNGNINEARESLIDGVHLLEESTVLKKSDCATLLWLEYSRLATLEFKTGEVEKEEVYLFKAKYWALIGCEFENKSAKVAINEVRAFDIRKCVSMVDEMDKGLHNDKLANYNIYSNNPTTAREISTKIKR